jgi:hypothetical protein
MSNESWGIIRYAPGTGNRPEDDRAAFDGWYARKEDAQEVFRYWFEKYTGSIVAVVLANEPDIRFTNSMWDREHWDTARHELQQLDEELQRNLLSRNYRGASRTRARATC